MFKLTISVDELVVDMKYTDYDKALFEFKDCVIDLLNRPECAHDDMIMKIDKHYALFIAQSDSNVYKLELQIDEEGK